MNTFANAVVNQEARTENNMKARQSTSSALVDFFYKAGAMRGQDIVPVFVAAYVEDRDLALRTALWLRDIREGAGERELFKQILKYLEVHSPSDAVRLLYKIPELGRWDDVFTFTNKDIKLIAYGMLEHALLQGNGLAAKWTPRQGKVAADFRAFMGMSPKNYRKTLVSLTNVVEQQMCANDWDNIDYSKVPSLASARYKKAFDRHSSKFKEYTDKLASGDTGVKVNAGAVYPYDVLKGCPCTQSGMTSAEINHIVAQWSALPNYIGDASILPMVDVSGSMDQVIGKNLNVMDIALSLGLYCSEKNIGKLKDMFLTFSGSPKLVPLNGNVTERFSQMSSSEWGMNTDLHKAIDKVLSVAIQGNVPQEEMPKILLILSDMQFDNCIEFDDSAHETAVRKYTQAGYDVPKIVFWNLAARDNVPVAQNEHGVALVSGFSPSILKSILSGTVEAFNPYNIMLETVMKDRYSMG